MDIVEFNRVSRSQIYRHNGMKNNFLNLIWQSQDKSIQLNQFED